MAIFHLDRYVVDVLLRDLVGHDHSPAAFIVYLISHDRPIAAYGRDNYERLREIKRAWEPDDVFRAHGHVPPAES